MNPLSYRWAYVDKRQRIPKYSLEVVKWVIFFILTIYVGI